MANLTFRLFLLFLLVALTSCDKEVSSRTISVEEQTVERYCSYNSMGYCFTCMPGFTGKMDCSFKMSAFCTRHGTEYVEEKRTTREVLYESGEQHILVDIQTVKVITQCR